MEVMQLLGSQGPWQSQACRDTDCLSHRSYDPIRVFSNLWQLAIRRPFWLVPLLLGPFGQGTQKALLTGALLYCSACQALKWLPWEGPSLLFQTIETSLSWVFLCFSAASDGVWGEGTVVAPAAVCDSATLPCLLGCLVFLHRHFSPQSPPSCSLGPSPHN